MSGVCGFEELQEAGNELSQELARLRNQSRLKLESAWARVEQLQQEGADAELRISELEERLAVLRTAPPKRDSEQVEHAVDEASESYTEETDDFDVVPETPPTDFFTAVRRLSTAHVRNSRPGRVNQSTISLDTSPTGNRPLVEFGRAQGPGLRSKRRNSCGGSIEFNSAAQMTLMSMPPQLQNDPRVHSLLVERDESLKDVQEEKQRKHIALETLHRTTTVQQEIIQQLQQELDELDAPNYRAKLQLEVKEKVEYMSELAFELETQERSLSARQRECRSLELQWHRLEDTIADAEGGSPACLEALQEKLSSRIRQGAHKLEVLSRFIESSSETLASLRQDLMDYLAPDATHKLMNDLQRNHRELRQKENSLADLLVERREVRNTLTDSLARTSGTKTRAALLIPRILDIIGTIEESRETPKFIFPKDGKSIESSSLVSALLEAVTDVLTTARTELEKTLSWMRSSSNDSGNELNDGEDLFHMIQKTSETVRSGLEELTHLLDESSTGTNANLVEIDEAPADHELNASERAFISLNETISEQEETLRSLQSDLEKLESHALSGTGNSLNMIEQMKQEVDSIVRGLDEKDRMITSVDALLNERKLVEKSLKDKVGLLSNQVTKPDDSRLLLRRSFSQRK